MCGMGASAFLVVVMVTTICGSGYYNNEYFHKIDPMTEGGDLITCGAKTRSGGKCKRPAGWGTNHVGNGKCKLHGGKSTGPAPENMRGKQNAAKWGFWSKHVTPEQLAIMQDIDTAEPADILWSNILVAYSAIIRAQKLMFVRDQNDHADFQSSISSSDSGSSEGHQREWSWDRHAKFMQAQARAQAELRSLIKEFSATADESDVRRLKLDSMQADIELKKAQTEKLRNPDGNEETTDDGFMDALKGRGSEVWTDDDDSGDDQEEV